MTKGGSGKPKMLGRLIFGEKRKQHASPSRHRSITRNDGNVADVSSPGGAADKNPINVHDWAAWRMQLNEQMGNGMIDPTNLKQMRQFLHSNSFYQQHSRDPSNGRYNGVRLLFSIPHAKIKPESNDRSRKGLNKNTNLDEEDTTICDQCNVHPNIDDRTITSVNSITVEPSIVTDKTISQLLPKNLIGNINGFLQTNEQMVAADASQTRHSMRASYTASDRVHSTLQKAVKDGNVLEKIKAFEMQAAAAQVVSTPKLGNSVGITINNRMQSVTSHIQSAAHRTLSPAVVHPISPMPIQHESQQQQQQQQQQYIRSHRNRYVHPVQHHRDGHLGPMIGRESRKGAHVLEPVHGDIILKRRTPSQKTINDEDYSMTAISSMALTASQGHRHHHYHHRASASRSRHHQESVHDKRSSSHHDNAHKKHQQKQKETTSSSNKTSTRRRWLKGRKETPTEPTSENGKQEVSTTKSSKNNKNKKKNNEKEKVESSKKATSPDLKDKPTSPDVKRKPTSTSDNKHVYDTSNISINEQTKTEPTSPQLTSSRIEEENESDREEKTIENKTDQTSTKEEEIIQRKEYDIKFERRPSKTKYHQKLSSTDGQILSKVEDETRFSCPTDDHAHRSELNDDDDEYKSEGDVFIEESYVTNINPQQKQSSNVIQRQSSQCSIEELSSDRRWQWSKESGGLIEKGNPKKKQQQQPITIITRKNKTNEEREQIVYETPSCEQIRTPTLKKNQSPNIIISLGNNDESNNNKQFSKQILYAIMNSKNKNPEQTTTDEFFDNGPHTNPEETIVNITSSA